MRVHQCSDGCGSFDRAILHKLKIGRFDRCVMCDVGGCRTQLV